jgi:hypothetical protein
MSGKTKKKSVRKKRARSLSGIETALAPTEVLQGELEAKQLGMGLLALAGANVVGSILLGKHAIWPAAGALAIGIMKKNLYWTMAGAGLLLANGYQQTAPPAPAVNGTEDEGFSLASFTDQAKERAKNYFSSFAEKLYLPKQAEAPAVSGMNGGDEGVNYFLNPYSQVGEVDTTGLDKLQMQIDNMNNAGASRADVVGEIDASERNF